MDCPDLFSLYARMRDEMLDHLQTAILPFWINHMQDLENGGFYPRMDAQGIIDTSAEKGAILNARILWTFSRAARLLGNPAYRKCAERAFQYIVSHFFDTRYGGTYWSLTALGQVANNRKQFYAQGFMIYGLAEYALLTRDDMALERAIELYRLIETHSRDKIHGGYIEAAARDWTPLHDMRLSEVDDNAPKSQNTHLHIIEPYTLLLKVLRSWQAPLSAACGATREQLIDTLGESIRHLIRVFLDHIVNASTGHLDLFFSLDWQVHGHRRESYGHDIECSWLLCEAAQELDDTVLTDEVWKVAERIAMASREGLEPDGSMIHEADMELQHRDTDRHWWVQAETVVGFVNAFQLNRKQEDLIAAIRAWQYIRKHLIAPSWGEWYWKCNAQGQPDDSAELAGFWKCPYHNARMCMEILERQNIISAYFPTI